MHPYRLAARLLAAATPAKPLEVETSQRVDGYEIHHNALRTEFLDATMARRYGITRSPHGGMLNLSIQRVAEDGSTRAVAASVRGEAVNLLGRRTPITFREIPGDEVSYIGLFERAGPDTWTFELSITPADAKRAIALRFHQDFTAP